MDIIILITVTAGIIIALIELLKLDRRAIGALLLTSIAFIYVGFAGQDIYLVATMGIQAGIFLLFAYLGLVMDSRFIPFGLILHAGWDLVHLYGFNNTQIISSYEWYCYNYSS